MKEVQEYTRREEKANKKETARETIAIIIGFLGTAMIGFGMGASIVAQQLLAQNEILLWANETTWLGLVMLLFSLIIAYHVKYQQEKNTEYISYQQKKLAEQERMNSVRNKE